MRNMPKLLNSFFIIMPGKVTYLASSLLWGFLREIRFYDPLLLQLHDLMIQIRIPSSRGEQLLVSAALDDPALFQHHDGVGFADGREAVGDHKSGAVFHQGVHAFLDVALRSGIHGGCGLVQNQDGGAGEGGAGDV